MTIKPYTFFSPDGTNYPVTANADGQLNQMLAGLTYYDVLRQDISVAFNVGLTRTYQKTTMLVGGRYFELENELVQLNAAATNFIHVVIDLSLPYKPVKLSVETSDQSNGSNVNFTSGILKVMIEKVVTGSADVITVTKANETRSFPNVFSSTIDTTKLKVKDIEATNTIIVPNVTISNKLTTKALQVNESTQTKNLTVIGEATVGGNIKAATANISGKIRAQDIQSTFGLISQTLNVVGKPSDRSNQFRTPNTYATITGKALEFFTFYKSANVVTCNFAGTPTSYSIDGGGAIVGWITDNDFKPDYTLNFTVFGADGKRYRFTVDAGGAIRSHEKVAANVEIWGSMQWIVAGTEGGFK